MKETDALDEYILQHIDPEGEYLEKLYRATHVPVWLRVTCREEC